MIKGISHITGGGFYENLPRMFSDQLTAEIIEDSWEILPIFKALEKYGQVPHDEMFQIFNMGIGMVLAVAPEKAEEVKQRVKCYEIGKITPRVKQAVIIK